MYIFQLTTLVVLLTLGLLRVIDPDFPFMIFLSSIGLLPTLVILFDTIERKVGPEITNPEFDRRVPPFNKVVKLKQLSAPIGFVVLVPLCYYDLIRPEVGDFLAILALGISLSNEMISDWIIKKFLSEMI